MTRSFVLAAVIFAAGCAGMSDTECRSASWYQLGERDALVYGLQPQIEIYEQQCSRHGVQPASKDYMAGWIVGNREWAIRVTSDCCAP